MPINFINHEGKEIILVDYSGLKTTEEMLANLQAFKDVMATRNEKARLLVDVTDAYGSKEWMEQAKGFAKENGAKVHKSTVVGVTGIKKVLLMGFNLVLDGRVKPFDTRDQALAYLVSD